MIVDTTDLFPEGEYTLTVADVPEQVERAGYVFWTFKFTTELDGFPASYEESVPVWLSAPMFRALGFKELRPGRFEVEPTAALDRKIKGRVVHETLASGKRAGSVVARLQGIAPAGVNDPALAIQAPLRTEPPAEVAGNTPDNEIPF